MTIGEFIFSLKIMSVEKPNSIASKSEIRRWLKQHSIIINRKTNWDFNDIITLPASVTIFPKSKVRKISF